jgi:asparagine synthase (glutamine-hydrolysing)
MCGIAGLWDRHLTSSAEALLAGVEAMTATLVYRGPDAGDVWIDRNTGVALGHRRLSIVDLSAAGAQPMNSSCGRFVITYNGEIYNTDELRSELEAQGRKFRGHSDTEVIVEGAAVWGVVATVRRLIGMFALALWDREARTLYLVRDRLGIKPVYWCDVAGRLRFGSELKALRADKQWAPELDRSALTAYMRFGYVPAPLTIYRGVKKLPPGSILTVRADDPPSVTTYWSLEEVAREGQHRRLYDEEDAVDALHTLLGDAVRRRMVADVPLGAFLSGGLDSSTVVALMQAQSPRPVRTFSIGFQEDGYDEAANAAAVARHLGTEHTELYASPQLALEVIPQLSEMFDEPFADSSQIPTYLVSRMTRTHVTVALSGDGGDEVFGGYTRYFRSEGLWRAIEAAPRPLRHFAASTVRTLSPAAWSALGNLLPQQRRPTQFGDKMHKLANVLGGEPEASSFYRQVVSLWLDPEALVGGGVEPGGLHQDIGVRELVPDFIERMQYIDTLTYLPDDILTKVDRASMAVSLEARVPLLDHRVVEFSWSLPTEMKAGRGLGKRILRRVLNRYVPETLVNRPKMGFAMPIGSWLRHELRDWAETLLDERRLSNDGLLNDTLVREKWCEHLAGRRNWAPQLWAVLMFQAWKERWIA